MTIVMVTTDPANNEDTAGAALSSGFSPSASTPTSPPPTSSSAAKPAPHRPTLAPAATVNAALGKLAGQLPAGGVSVAALNTKTGARFTYGATTGMRTGSVAKLFLLEAVLLQHQDDGTQLSDYEMDLATPMIENSDNKAEYSLFLDAGGNEALEDAFPRLGLDHTVPGISDPALTTTDSADGVTLVDNLVRTNGPLNAYSRSLALGLMRNVESDQRWGVSAAADRGSTVALKNGWLSVDNDNDASENDDGRWLVNSVGVVTVRGQQVVLAAFTQHGPDFVSGVHLVESLVKTITPAVVAR
ncbi:MAG TPA: serine hydrolase [Jatrophihabitantaceae bacterium]